VWPIGIGFFRGKSKISQGFDPARFSREKQRPITAAEQRENSDTFVTISAIISDINATILGYITPNVHAKVSQDDALHAI
jgi:hypothetical protein